MQAEPAISPVPTPHEAHMNARAMFQRVLSGWAMDVLALRRRGWDRPCMRLAGTETDRADARRPRRSAPRKRAA
ncbi:MAG TPA: hypothetical protein VHC70_01120 [Phycisphaerales bacterium]|jgi:hypothetical protein|nr:hypothetical protein [Phycisphaerales bacterium]